MATKTQKTKNRASKKRKTLSRPLKKNYDYWLDWKYYGEKITYDEIDSETGEVVQAERIVAVNPKKSLNFWAEKNGLTGIQKQETVCDLYRLYRRYEVSQSALISFCNKISQTKISEHNEGIATFYYCCDPFAKVVNLCFDWDDKERVYLDTEAAARWLNDRFFFGQSFIQSSTSGTGTHQYVFVQTSGGTVINQKQVYQELIGYLREEVRQQGFLCWEGIDQVKGIGPEVSWHSSKHPKVSRSPMFLKIDKGGIFAKLPRLSGPNDEQVWLDRKVLSWSHLTRVLRELRHKHGATVVPSHTQGEAGRRRIDGCVTGTVETGLTDLIQIDDFDATTPASLVTEVVRLRLQAMLDGGNKQQVALGTVFAFENKYDRRPQSSEADFVLLNDIYSQTKTATGTSLTDDRRKRFGSAISFSGGRKKSETKKLIAPEMIQNSTVYFGIADLSTINQKLAKQNQRAMTAFDLGRCWCYFVTAFKSKEGTSEGGRVPWKAIKGLSVCDHAYDPEQFPKQSRNIITESLKVFETLGLIKTVVKHDRISRDCAKYDILEDPIRVGRDDPLRLAVTHPPIPSLPASPFI